MSFQHWPASDILALFHLENVNDSSGNSHTLTNNGTVTFGAGKFSNCALLGVANNSKYLSHADGLGEDLNGASGVSFWIYLQTLPASGECQTFLRWYSTAGTARGYYIDYRNNSGTKKLRVSSSSGSDIDIAINLATNTWYKIDFVRYTDIKLYLNGALIGTGTLGTAAGTTNIVALGANYVTTATDYTKGNIDEAVFFSAARSAADIRRRYAFEKGMLV